MVFSASCLEEEDEDGVWEGVCTLEEEEEVVGLEAATSFWESTEEVEPWAWAILWVASGAAAARAGAEALVKT